MRCELWPNEASEECPDLFLVIEEEDIPCDPNEVIERARQHRAITIDDDGEEVFWALFLLKDSEDDPPWDMHQGPFEAELYRLSILYS